MADDRTARVGGVRLRISVPGGMPAMYRTRRWPSSRTARVHNTLRHEPAISIELDM